jgi:hypothetical protein
LETATARAGGYFNLPLVFYDGLPINGKDFKYPLPPGSLLDGLYTAPHHPSTVPIRVSLGSLLGNLSSANVLSDLVKEGRITEEYKEGKWYYAVPFEYTFLYDKTLPKHGQLGFVFYSYLSIASWLKDMGGQVSDMLPESYKDYESLIIEGPVNTEIVFTPGNKVAKEREVFVAPGAKTWEGSVHYHSVDDPSPDGYVGWMSGQEHIAGANQHKLELLTVPNKKIVDNRYLKTNFAEVPPQGIVGAGTLEHMSPYASVGEKLFKWGSDDPPIGLGPAYETAQGVIDFFGPGVKIRPSDSSVTLRKHFSDGNDDEYSNLYITRDRSNNARGMFFINFQNLLKNDSHLYGALTSRAKEEFIQEILQKCEILELRVYRDRVKKQLSSLGTNIFENDKIYEESSHLVAKINDINGYRTARNNNDIVEIELDKNNVKDRYFVFSDRDVGSAEAGLYQYRVEIDFKDGTYEFLNKKLNNLSDTRMLLSVYYDLSMSGDNVQESDPQSFTMLGGFTKNKSTYDKAYFKPYYDSLTRSFREDFLLAASNMLPGGLGYSNGPWFSAPTYVAEMETILTDKARELDPVGPLLNLLNMANPETGSPQGIGMVLKILDGYIEKLEAILGAVKRKSTGSELSNSTSTSVKNTTKYDSSPSRSIIREEPHL